MDDTARGLLLKCLGATRDGMDFPSIWDDILRQHFLVLGPPIQINRNGLPHLEIPLLGSRTLLYNSSTREFFFS